MSTHLYFTTTETPSAKATPLTGHPAIPNGTDQPSTLEPTASTQSPVLRLVAAFEDGRVEHWECRDWSKRTDPRMRGASESSTELSGWHNLWTQKGHNEASTSPSSSRPLAELSLIRARSYGDGRVADFGLCVYRFGGPSGRQVRSTGTP